MCSFDPQILSSLSALCSLTAEHKDHNASNWHYSSGFQVLTGRADPCATMWGHQAYWSIVLLRSNTQPNHEFWATKTFVLGLLCSPGHFRLWRGHHAQKCIAGTFSNLISSFLCSSMYLWLSGAVCISVCPLLAAVPCLTSRWDWGKR